MLLSCCMGHLIRGAGVADAARYTSGGMTSSHEMTIMLPLSGKNGGNILSILGS